MSLARHSFANIVPTDKRKLGSRAYSSSQVTNMIKANANTAVRKRFAFGVSSYYRVHSGLINDYRIIASVGRGDPILNGDILDGNGELNLLILEGNSENPGFILDGN